MILWCEVSKSLWLDLLDKNPSKIVCNMTCSWVIIFVPVEIWGNFRVVSLMERGESFFELRAKSEFHRNISPFTFVMLESIPCPLLYPATVRWCCCSDAGYEALCIIIGRSSAPKRILVIIELELLERINSVSPVKMVSSLDAGINHLTYLVSNVLLEDTGSLLSPSNTEKINDILRHWRKHFRW
jgi:hypothetical protein